MVSKCRSQRQLRQSYPAQDLGLLAVPARHGSAFTDGSLRSRQSAANPGLSLHPTQRAARNLSNGIVNYPDPDEVR